MKKLFLLLSLTVIALSALAQNIGEALYIYRNDGQFNAFFRDEIDSIAYSHYDGDSVRYDDVVTQVVYTSDSVYTIPLAAIDSISFVQPIPVYKENTKELSKELSDYVISVDSMTIYLNGDTPLDIIPTIGDKLVELRYTDVFPDGFAGSVINVIPEGNQIKIECTAIAIEDAVKRYYGVYNITTAIDENQTMARGIKRSSSVKDLFHKQFLGGRIPLHWNLDGINIWKKVLSPYQTEGGLTSDIWFNIEPTVDIKLTVSTDEFIGLVPKYNVHVGTSFSLEEEVKIGGELSGEAQYSLIPGGAMDIPIVPGFNYYIDLGFKISGKGEIGLHNVFTQEGYDVLDLDIYPTILSPLPGLLGVPGPLTIINSHELKFNKLNKDWFYLYGNIEIEVGPYLEFGFSFLNKEIAKIGAEIDGGVKVALQLEHNINQWNKAEEDTLYYDHQKENCKVDCNFYLGAYVIAALFEKTNLFGEKKGKTWRFKIGGEIESKDLFHYEAFLMPAFDNVKLVRDISNPSKLTAFADISRTCLFPMTVGFSLFNSKDEFVQHIPFEANKYWTPNSMSFYNVEFSTTNIEEDYKVYPTVKFFNKNVLATPSAKLLLPSAKITSFSVTDTEYSKAAFTNDNKKYDFSYNTSLTVVLESADNVEDWGYVYEDPDHQIKHISLKGKESPYTDTNYAFYRNKPMSTACLYGYVKYVGDNNYHYGEKKDYPLIYDKQPEATTLEVISVDETTAIVKCGYKEVEPWGGICGIEYWEDTHTNQSKKLFFETAQEEIEITLTDLKPNSLYYYQAFVKRGENEEDVMAMEVNSFTTMPAISFSTGEAINKTVSSATLTGSVEGYDPSDERIKFAFFYSTDKDILNSLDGKSVVPIYDGNGTLSADISNLMEYTTYYYTLAIKRGDSDYEPSGVKSFRTSPIVRTMENPTATHNSVTLQGTCSKGITVAGFSIKKDGDTDYTQYSAVPDENGNFSATIDGLTPNTSYAYYAFVIADEQTYPGDKYSFTTKQQEQVQLCPDNNHPHLIDLGLPSGTKWACCNVGASNPSDCGGYYAWGETYQKPDYDFSNYAFCEGTRETCQYIGQDIGQTQYDAATINWGNEWRMPTSDECFELVNNCSTKIVNNSGIIGLEFIGANGNIIFLPSAGCKGWWGISGYGTMGEYWSATPSDGFYEGGAYTVSFEQSAGRGAEIRAYGLCIRPVQSGIKVTTEDAIDVQAISATLSGAVENYDQTDESINFVFLYSKSEDILNSSDGRTVEGICADNGNLTSDISDLTDYTTYYYAAAYKQGDADYVLGEVKSFKTLPVVTTLDNAATTIASAILHGKTSKGIYIAGFSLKKDGDTEYTQYSAVPDENGDFSVTIKGLDIEAHYVYYAFIQADEQTHNGLEYSFTTKPLCPDNNHPHMIDLGLPFGTKWACCNVGATKPEEYGGYYAWGETSEKDWYSWKTYRHAHVVDRDLDLYASEFYDDGQFYESDNIGNDISSTQYDSARANWGEPWRLPSYDECQALVSSFSMWTNVNGVDGRIFVGPNGNGVFLPATGGRYNNVHTDIGYGYYQSGTLKTDISPWPPAEHDIIFNVTSIHMGYWAVHNGKSVRPVQDGN